MNKYTRRKFLRDSSIATLALSAGPLIKASDLFSAEKGIDLAVCGGESPFDITVKAVEFLGGMKKFVAKNDVVLIKPNMGWDRTPQQAANTNPYVMAALVKMAFDAGAKRVKVMDNTCNDARRCYVNSGVQKETKKYGATVLHVEDFRIKKMKIGGDVIKDWEVYKDFVECDCLINVPILKHHSLSKLTLGMKNWLGAIGGRRWVLHQNINTTMVDLAAFFKPKLTVLDSYRILLRNGPQGGSLGDVKTVKKVTAGVDPIAVDSMGVKIFSGKRQDFEFLSIGKKRGLGEYDLSKLNVKEVKLGKA